MLAVVLVIARMARLVRPPLDMFPMGMLLLPQITVFILVMLVFLVMLVLILMVVVRVVMMPP